LIPDDLRRGDAGNRHVFHLAASSLGELPAQFCHLLLIEQPRPLQRLGGKLLPDQWRGTPMKKAAAHGGPVGVLRPLPDRFRYISPDGLFQQILLLQAADLEPRRNPAHKLHEPIVQVGHADLHGIRHRDPVALRGEKVVAQKYSHFQVLRPGHGVPPIELGGQDSYQLPGIPLCAARPQQVSGEEHLASLRVLPPDMVRREWVGQPVEPPREERRQQRPLSRIGKDVGIELANDLPPECRVGLLRDEVSSLRLPEYVVSPEDLVGPLSRQHHLEPMLADASGQQVEGHRRRAQQGALAVPQDIGDCLTDLLVRRFHGRVPGANFADHDFLEASFVKQGVFEPDPERPDPGEEIPDQQAGDGCGIEAAAYVAADGDIGSKPDPDRVEQQLPQLLGHIRQGALETLSICRKRNVPVLPDGQSAIGKNHEVPGLQLPNVPEGRLAGQDGPVAEHVMQRLEVQLPGYGPVNEDRLDLGGKDQGSVPYRVVQRPDAEPVPRKEQALAAAVPERKGKLAAEPRET